MASKEIKTLIEDLIIAAMNAERMKIEPQRYRQYAGERLTEAREELLNAIKQQSSTVMPKSVKAQDN